MRRGEGETPKTTIRPCSSIGSNPQKTNIVCSTKKKQGHTKDGGRVEKRGPHSLLSQFSRQDETTLGKASRGESTSEREEREKRQQRTARKGGRNEYSSIRKQVARLPVGRVNRQNKKGKEWGVPKNQK